MLAARILRPSIARAPWQLASLAFLAVLLTLDHPGVTIDEPLDVRPGRTYLETLAAEGLGFFRADVVERVFRDNAEHPPLGRLLLGLASKAGETVEIMLAGGPDPTGLYVRSGRIAPALCFAALVWLVVREAGRRNGMVAGLAAGLSLIAMPRVFSHAHLGALDMFITFFWVNAYLAADRALDSKRPIRPMGWAGLAWGMALLTKIHAWLLPPLLLVTALARPDRRPRLIGLIVWGLVGCGVFFLGWPWLWYDPVERFARFLGTGVERTPIRVLYFGQVYVDKLVPWHFPWFYFLATVPVGLQCLGVWGAIRSWKDRTSGGADLRALLAVIALLSLFSTNVPVYDGERLYLMAFPLWALLIGRGFGDLWDRVASIRWGRRALTMALLAQFWGVVSIHPYGLSYYNLSVGGLPGAQRLGLELVYWSEPVDPPLLNALVSRAEPGSSASLAPTLAPNQGKLLTSRAMLRRSVLLEDQEGLASSEWLVVYRREAYFNEDVRRAVAEGEVVQRESRQGVWLSALIRLRKSRGSP